MFLIPQARLYLFRNQIAAGGPITLTHPDRPLFHDNPGGCSVVLQSSSLAKGGDVFLLDMGEPVL